MNPQEIFLPWCNDNQLYLWKCNWNTCTISQYMNVSSHLPTSNQLLTILHTPTSKANQLCLLVTEGGFVPLLVLVGSKTKNLFLPLNILVFGKTLEVNSWEVVCTFDSYNNLPWWYQKIGIKERKSTYIIPQKCLWMYIVSHSYAKLGE